MSAVILARVYYRDTGNLCDVVEFVTSQELITYLWGFYRNTTVYRWSISEAK